MQIKKCVKSTMPDNFKGTVLCQNRLRHTGLQNLPINSPYLENALNLQKTFRQILTKIKFSFVLYRLERAKKTIQRYCTIIFSI
jgi:hypothetical protein